LSGGALTLGASSNGTVIGGTGTTSTLTLQSTSGVGATGATINFLVGNNGATVAETILNNGNVGIGTANPAGKLDISYSGGSGTGLNIINTSASNFAEMRLLNSSGQLGQFFKTGASYTPYKIFGALDFGIYNNVGGNMSFLNDNASGNINFAAGGVSTAQMTLTASGVVTVNQPGIGSTPTYNIQSINATAAAAGSQQWACGPLIQGQGWGTTAPGSQSVAFGTCVQPVQGAAPTGQLNWYSIINGTSTNVMSLTSGGGLTITGTASAALYASATNCSSSASPAVCAAAAAGSVVVAAAATTVTVNTTAVTANSQIMVLYDSSLGTKLGVTCNATEPALYGVTARVAATSFTITSSAPITNPACFSYLIIN
jgi:hypothetical protein